MAQRKTTELERRVTALRSVLGAGFRDPGGWIFDSMLRDVHVAQLDLGDLAEPLVPTPWELAEPPAPGVLSRVFGGTRQ